MEKLTILLVESRCIQAPSGMVLSSMVGPWGSGPSQARRLASCSPRLGSQPLPGGAGTRTRPGDELDSSEFVAWGSEAVCAVLQTAAAYEELPRLTRPTRHAAPRRTCDELREPLARGAPKRCLQPSGDFTLNSGPPERVPKRGPCGSGIALSPRSLLTFTLRRSGRAITTEPPRRRAQPQVRQTNVS